MLKLLEGLPDNVLGVSAEGKITGTDYETVLIPAIEKKLKEHKKIRMVYQARKQTLPDLILALCWMMPKWE